MADPQIVPDAPVHEPPPSSEAPPALPAEDEAFDDEAALQEELGREPETTESEESTDEPAAADEEFEEFEWEGKTIKGPKGLKNGVLMQADYTRKTQEVAERRRELDAREEQLAQRTQLTDEDFQLQARQWAHAEELKQYENIDWDAWTDQDPNAAEKGWRRFQMLQQAQTRIDAALRERTDKRSQAVRENLQSRLDETRKFAEANIKGYTRERESQVMDFAMKELGYTPQQLANAMSPAVFRTLHLAALGHAVETQPASKPPPILKPTRQVGARASPPPQNDPTRMSDSDFAKHLGLGEFGRR